MSGNGVAAGCLLPETLCVMSVPCILLRPWRRFCCSLDRVYQQLKGGWQKCVLQHKQREHFLLADLPPLKQKHRKQIQQRNSAHLLVAHAVYVTA